MSSGEEYVQTEYVQAMNQDPASTQASAAAPAAAPVAAPAAAPVAPATTLAEEIVAAAKTAAAPAAPDATYAAVATSNNAASFVPGIVPDSDLTDAQRARIKKDEEETTEAIKPFKAKLQVFNKIINTSYSSESCVHAVQVSPDFAAWGIADRTAREAFIKKVATGRLALYRTVSGDYKGGFLARADGESTVARAVFTPDKDGEFLLTPCPKDGKPLQSCKSFFVRQTGNVVKDVFPGLRQVLGFIDDVKPNGEIELSTGGLEVGDFVEEQEEKGLFFVRRYITAPSTTETAAPAPSTTEAAAPAPSTTETAAPVPPTTGAAAPAPPATSSSSWLPSWLSSS